MLTLLHSACLILISVAISQSSVREWFPIFRLYVAAAVISDIVWILSSASRSYWIVVPVLLLLHVASCCEAVFRLYSTLAITAQRRTRWRFSICIAVSMGAAALVADNTINMPTALFRAELAVFCASAGMIAGAFLLVFAWRTMHLYRIVVAHSALLLINNVVSIWGLMPYSRWDDKDMDVRAVKIAVLVSWMFIFWQGIRWQREVFWADRPVIFPR